MPSQPLDLRAVEQRHRATLVAGGGWDGTGSIRTSQADVLLLLAALRATRAALQELIWSMGKMHQHRTGCITLVQADAECTCGFLQLKQARAVLASVTND